MKSSIFDMLESRIKFGLIALFAITWGCAAQPDSDSDSGQEGSQGNDDSSDENSEDVEAPDLERDAEFWQAVEIRAEWAENYPTLEALVRVADQVVVGRFQGIEPYAITQGDANEDIVAEALIHVEVDEVIHGDVHHDAVDLTLVLPSIFTRAEFEPTINYLQTVLPTVPIIAVLRARKLGPFRVVNGYGLWAETRRTKIDAPLNYYLPSEGVYVHEIAALSGIKELIDVMRRYGVRRLSVDVP